MCFRNLQFSGFIFEARLSDVDFLEYLDGEETMNRRHTYIVMMKQSDALWRGRFGLGTPQTANIRRILLK